MAKTTYIATVQVIIDPAAKIKGSGDAADWFSGLLTDHDEVLDWQYLRVGGQFLHPTQIIVDNNYEEGEGFRP